MTNHIDVVYPQFSTGILWRTVGRQRRAPGHRIINRGYALVWYPDHPLAQSSGYVRENRYVAWETFGPFDPSCEVHHEDEDKLNNDPSNLKVLPSKVHKSLHGDGKRFPNNTRGAGQHTVRHLTPEQIDRDAKVIHLGHGGMSNRRIAAQLGLSESMVSKILMRNGKAPSVGWMLG